MTNSEQNPCRFRVALVGYGSHPEVASTVARLRPIIEQQADVVHCDLGFDQDLSSVDADLVLVFGGDGSILHAAKLMGYRQKPALGVNLGKLGFLAAILPDELLKALDELCAGRFRTIGHLMFETRVFRNGELAFQQLGLNETSVLAGPPFSILDVQLFINGELVTTYSGDGLIISTPVGSTAHNLSAGGPILRKDLQAFVISPISPHTLTNRPVVDLAEREYELVIQQPNAGTAVVVDGHVLCNVQPNDRIQVRQAPAQFKLVEIAGHSYYRSLREKLGWGGSFRGESRTGDSRAGRNP